MGIYSRDPMDAPLKLYLEALCKDSSDDAVLFEPEGFFIGFDADLPVDLGMSLSLIPPIMIPIDYGAIIEIHPRLWMRKDI
jgi:hypothetical protein